MRLRFQQSGSAQDLEEAIGIHREATEAADAADPYRPRYYSNLSAALISRYGRDGDSVDLDRAVDSARQAVGGSAGPADRGRCLSTLANALMARFERLNAGQDLDEVVSTMRTAVGLLPQGTLDRVRYLTNLGIAQQNRFQRTESHADLRESVHVARRALEESAPDAPATRGEPALALLHDLESVAPHPIPDSLTAMLDPPPAARRPPPAGAARRHRHARRGHRTGGRRGLQRIPGGLGPAEPESWGKPPGREGRRKRLWPGRRWPNGLPPWW